MCQMDDLLASLSPGFPQVTHRLYYYLSFLTLQHLVANGCIAELHIVGNSW